MEKPQDGKFSEETYQAFKKAMHNVTGIPADTFSRNYLKREMATPSKVTGCDSCGANKTTLYRHGEQLFCRQHRPFGE